MKPIATDHKFARRTQCALTANSYPLSAARAASSPAEIILSKVPLPTHLDSAEIRSRVAREIRERALFSARMASESYLKDLRRVLAAYIGGDINAAEARERLRFKLSSLGLDGGTHALTDPGSLRRLNLILQTQRKMAASVARIHSRDPDELEDWPAWRLERYGSRREPREDWLRRWQAAGEAVGWRGAHRRQMVALKSSPIWEALGRGAGGFRDTLGNPYPPFAYGSGMDWTDVSAEEAARLGLEPDGSIPKVSLSPDDQEVARAIGRSGVLDSLTVANSVCRAKNPATCRIHGTKPGHGQREPETKAVKDSLGKTFDPKHPERYTVSDNIARGKKALARAMARRADVVDAMHRPECGSIDFEFGYAGTPGNKYHDGYGLLHIFHNHPEDLMHLPEVIARGAAYQVKSKGPDGEQGYNGRLAFVYGKRAFFVDPKPKGKGLVVTGLQKEPKTLAEIEKNPKAEAKGSK